MSIRRAFLTINHVAREILCNQDDSLTDVLRQIGLTGTKGSCRTGQCGACSVLLDGKLVRSCIRKMKSIKDYSVVETIEGFGTPENLHPLQQAFLTYAAVQCGYCSPGFILSAKALLNINDNPTRQEIRDWFTKNNNVCRCTGYKPIIDAVVNAAAVMRGEKSFEDICPKLPEDGQVYGTDFPKPEGKSRVLGVCDYGGDIGEKLPHGSYHLALVLARVHSAKLDSIDDSVALSMPGVKAVITAKHVKGTNRFFAAQGTPHSLGHSKERPVLVDEYIYRYGDVVAIVAASSREEARAAAAKVVVNYTELPAVLNFIEAAAPNAKQVHENIPNIYMEQPLYKGDDTRTMFTDKVHTVEAAFSTTRQPHLTIEADVVQAYPQDGGVTIQCKTQYLYGIPGQLAGAIGLEPKDIRMIGNPAGGSFGYSMSPGNYALAAVCALELNALVSLEMSYDEHQHTTGKRSPIHANARLACDNDGKLVALDCLIGLDHGAYSEMAGALTTKVVRFIGYYYKTPNIRTLVRTAFTNSNFGTAFRAFGSPQAYFVSEQLVDMLAIKMGMDPFEFRYMNLAEEGDLSTSSVPYREYVMKPLMDKIRPYYEQGKKNAKELSTDKIKRGVGISLGGYHVSKVPDHAEVDIELTGTNTVTVYSTWADVGQGTDFGLIAHTQKSLRALNLSVDDIKLIKNDTATCPDTGSASGSRSHHAAGLAIINAAEQMLSAMTKADGTYRSYEEMKAENIQTRFHGEYSAHWTDIHPDTGHGYGNVGQNYVITVVEVEVDVETGKTTVVDSYVAADVGNIGSYHAVLGQAWGGFAQSIGFALCENYEDMKKHETLRGANVIRCNDVPDNIHVDFQITPREDGPHGSTGCAEGFQSCGHVAIINAIANAADVRITTLPATPEKVKQAMGAQSRGEDYSQKPWDLGCDLYERLDYLQETRVDKK